LIRRAFHHFRRPRAGLPRRRRGHRRGARPV